ncbi:MAG: hypothetical protein KKC76_01310 [Proteobacteria bacterium]|nr:hypothetical protein [Pseudomonadota bacterium]MBU4295854.1 hypothetical protein [Pseudomonadota bacterium]MCG2747878.1 hypothetical protein [Desulfobulbaceae bacterium]
MGKRYLCLFVSILILFAGCGGNDQSSESSQGKLTTVQTVQRAADCQIKEPCELITRAEAGSLIGEEVKDGQYGEQKVVGMKKCFYEASNPDSVKFMQITVQQSAFIPPQVREAGQSPEIIFAETKKMLADGRVDLTGFGDEAFIGTGGLHMLSGDYYITIGVGNPDRDGNRQKLEAAARLVLGKLQGQ